MATNIPPHNMREVIDARRLADREDADGAGRRADASPASRSCSELIRLIPGPDFPTGGLIVGRRGIHEAYVTGRGGIQVRAKAEIEPMKKGDRQQIVITEIPYQVNKKKLLERIADLVREKTIEGISDIRDESDRDGMRVVIELKRGEVGEVVLNNLYKHTQLQQTFGIIMLAIVAGRPRVLIAARGDRALHRVPPRGRPPPDRVRAAQGRGPRPHPRRPPHRPRPPRRGDHADPRARRPRPRPRSA